MLKKSLIGFTILCTFISGQSAAENLPKEARTSINDFSANVMLLDKIDFSTKDKKKQFQRKLITAKLSGVDAVTVHVWWGLVEGSGDQKFDWSYYDDLFKIIKGIALKIQPVISFHKCNSSSESAVSIPIPDWIWKVAGKGNKYINELKEPGNDEYVSLWAENGKDVIKQYSQFMSEFQSHFAKYADIIQSVLISCGPSGECRYPSYDIMYAGGQSYGRGYPTRGFLYCFSEQAISDFRASMKSKYRKIPKLNKAWGTEFKSFSKINLPQNGDKFFDIREKDSFCKTQYGKDFVDWYNLALAEHVKGMLLAAVAAFNNELKNVPIGVKIPAVYWTMGDPVMPRSAEICAGLLNSQLILDADESECGKGYSTLLKAIKSVELNSKTHVIFAVFCGLDFLNNNCPPAYSMAEDLVFGFGAQANDVGLMVNGENIKLPSGSSTWNKKSFWWNINNALIWCWYDGVTVRYLDDIQPDEQAENYERLIELHENVE